MLDLRDLAEATARHGTVVRITVADHKGSTPRETGTSMIVSRTATIGTIGGGNLEFEATRRARAMLENGPQAAILRQALGPMLKQCCGGAVTLVSEVFDQSRLAMAQELSGASGFWARPIEDAFAPMPGALARALKRAAETGTLPATQLQGGWLVEPTRQFRRQVYIYGAGHVGRALACVLAPLPGFQTALVDLRAEQFADLPASIDKHWNTQPTEVMAKASADAIHIIMTPEHDFDLELCHQALKQECGMIGLIGSRTKWARFKSRLAALGHEPAQIARITCPIGDPALGKNPQAIAIGVAACLLAGKITTSQPRNVSV